MNIDWTASATFVAVLVLFLAAIGAATLAVAAWTLFVARWEGRQHQRQADEIRRIFALPQQRTESSAAFRSVDGNGNVRVVRGPQGGAS